MGSRLSRAGTLWESGDLAGATVELETALDEARSNPFKVRFRTRIQAATMLAGAWLAAGETEKPRHMLERELSLVDEVFGFIQASGDATAKRAALGDYMQLRDLATKVSLLGEPAPEIRVSHWIGTEPLSLADLRGRVVLLVFWATWCRQCDRLFPTLGRLYEAHSSRGFIVLALTHYYMAYQGDPALREREIELIHQFTREHAMAFPVGIADDEQTNNLYGATGLPSLALIDRHGRVRYSYGSGEDEMFNRILDACLAEPAWRRLRSSNSYLLVPK